MKIYGYIRVSTDSQDLYKQKHLLYEHAQSNKILINEFIEVEMSSRKNKTQRKIDLLIQKMEKGDLLLVAELSRLGRNMLETLNIINELNENGITIKFIRQPELSTDSSHTKLLFAVYSYFAEAERDYISMRTKQGLLAAKSQGKILGRPQGSGNKKGRGLDPFKEQIKEYIKIGLSVNAISKIINNQLENSYSYNTYRNFIKTINIS
jgi:DNA invertase Pin-like site-specific DNA recombinase